jgi:hypothetical protein
MEMSSCYRHTPKAPLSRKKYAKDTEEEDSLGSRPGWTPEKEKISVRLKNRTAILKWPSLWCSHYTD